MSCKRCSRPQWQQSHKNHHSNHDRDRDKKIWKSDWFGGLLDLSEARPSKWNLAKLALVGTKKLCYFLGGVQGHSVESRKVIASIHRKCPGSFRVLFLRPFQPVRIGFGKDSHPQNVDQFAFLTAASWLDFNLGRTRDHGLTHSGSSSCE